MAADAISFQAAMIERIGKQVRANPLRVRHAKATHGHCNLRPDQEAELATSATRVRDDLAHLMKVVPHPDAEGAELSKLLAVARVVMDDGLPSIDACTRPRDPAFGNPRDRGGRRTQ